MRTAIVLAACALAIVACKRKAPAEVPDASQAAEQPAADAEAPKLAPARCKVEPTGTKLADNVADLEIGEGVATPIGFAIGVLRKVNGESTASIALVPAQGGAPAFVDLGSPLGDASPPKPFARGGDLFAAYFPRPSAPAAAPKPKQVPTRDLAIVRIDGGKAQPSLAIAEERDESLAYDVAASDKGILVAWDEDAIGNERGAIKIAMLSPDGKAVASSRIASPDASDAEIPRVLPRRGGYWLVYVASRAEVARDAAPPDPNHAIERPGRDRAFRWLEMLPLDERGEATGPARKLTSERGHVSLFDLAARADGVTLDIVARDEELVTAGEAGRLLRITVKGDAPDAAIAIVSDAVGRGAPELLGDGAAWLAFDDAADKLRLLPLDATRAPAGLPSIEDALDRARPVLATKAAPDALELLAAFPEDAAAQLHRARCTR